LTRFGLVDTSWLALEVFDMAEKSVRYTPEFKRQMVDLVRIGRSAGSLAKEFGPTAWSIALWVKQGYRQRRRGFDDRGARRVNPIAA
jgi:transposase-like protein